MRQPDRAATWIGLEQALDRILPFITPTNIEECALDDALGRVLAEPAMAPLDLPPWDNSAMDGFAVRSADIEGASQERPVRLTLVDSVPAGGVAARPVGAREAVKIMTGAPVPAGADSIVRVEHTQEDGASVVILSGMDARRNIRKRGEDVAANQVAVSAGSPLRAGEIGLLAAIGCASVRVHRRPAVAILSTGDELVSVDQFEEVLAGRRIVNSNSYALAAAVRSVGAKPLTLGIARDDKRDLREHLQRGLNADALVTSAGASVGEHDLVKDVLEELGAHTDFWRVRMRPGSPFSFGRLHGVPLFGLPGNPVSAIVTFELLVKPALRRMIGRHALYSPVVSARLADDVASKTGPAQFMRVTLEPVADGLVARLTGAQGSGLLSSIARADGLLVVPEDVDGLPAGSEVRVVRLLATDDTQMQPGFRTRMTT